MKDVRPFVNLPDGLAPVQVGRGIVDDHIALVREADANDQMTG